VKENGVPLKVYAKVLAKAVRNSFRSTLPAIAVFLPLMPIGVEHT